MGAEHRGCAEVMANEMRPPEAEMADQGGQSTNAAKLERAEVEHRLGLDQPFPVQFWRWLVAVLHGDLGTSFTSGKPVTELIFERMPITLSLTAGATMIGLLVAIPMGVYAATRRGSWMDRATILGTSLGIAAPEFFIGLLLVLVISLQWGLLPATGYVPFADDPLEFVLRLTLPSITLGLSVAAELAPVRRLNERPQESAGGGKRRRA